MGPILTAYLANFLCNFAGFAISTIFKTDVFFDITGAISHIVSLATLLYISKPQSTRLHLLSLLVFLWASRIGVFLFVRARLFGEKRLTPFLSSQLKLFYVFFAQSVWVFFNLLPLSIVASARPHHQHALGVVDMYALGVYIVFFVVEVVADDQKFQFRSLPENRNKYITSGLYRYSQHPNYFAEFALWITLTYLTSPVIFNVGGSVRYALLSSLFVLLLITYRTGIRPLSIAGMKKWGKDPAYLAYVNNTSLLVPWLPAATSAKPGTAIAKPAAAPAPVATPSKSSRASSPRRSTSKSRRNQG
jgi:steroid 5-alpha reductase family enzyme